MKAISGPLQFLFQLQYFFYCKPSGTESNNEEHNLVDFISNGHWLIENINVIFLILFLGKIIFLFSYNVKT